MSCCCFSIVRGNMQFSVTAIRNPCAETRVYSIPTVKSYELIFSGIRIQETADAIYRKAFG